MLQPARHTVAAILAGSWAPPSCSKQALQSRAGCSARPLLPNPAELYPTRSLTPLRLGIDSTRHNYLLLGLAIFQFPLNAWLARVPPLPAAAAATVKAAVNQATEPLML